jgi:hypothetical protein
MSCIKEKKYNRFKSIFIPENLKDTYLSEYHIYQPFDKSEMDTLRKKIEGDPKILLEMLKAEMTCDRFDYDRLNSFNDVTLKEKYLILLALNYFNE